MIITTGPSAQPVEFPIFPGVPLNGIGWWWNGMDGGDPAGGGNGNGGSNGGGSPGGGSGGSPGSPSSGGSGGGSNDTEEPGWEEPPCGGVWEGDLYKKIPCDDEKDVNGYYYSRLSIISRLLEQDPFALEPYEEINQIAAFGNMYQSVASHQVPQNVKDRIVSFNSQLALNGIHLPDLFEVQNLDNAFGGIVNCDFFPVRIKRLPLGMSASSILEYFRLNMNQFTSSLANFSPYMQTYTGLGNPNNVIMTIDENQLFNSPFQASIGSLIHISMPNSGTVVESGYEQNFTSNFEYHNFTFSTMTSPLDFNHPVSGNRRMGIYSYTGDDPSRVGEFTFYTMRVDRISDWQFALGNNIVDIFENADNLWKAMQTNMINYINTNGGLAENYSPMQYTPRPKWDDIKEYLQGKIDFAELKTRMGC